MQKRNNKQIIIISKENAKKFGLFKKKKLYENNMKIAKTNGIECIAHIKYDRRGYFFVPKESVPIQEYEKQVNFLRMTDEYKSLLEIVELGGCAISTYMPYTQQYSQDY